MLCYTRITYVEIKFIPYNSNFSTKIRKQCPLISKITLICTKCKHNVKRTCQFITLDHILDPRSCLIVGFIELNILICEFHQNHNYACKQTMSLHVCAYYFLKHFSVAVSYPVDTGYNVSYMYQYVLVLGEKLLQEKCSYISCKNE